MKQTSLKAVVEDHGLTTVATRLGCSPPAIQKAVRSNREVIVTIKKDGSMSAKEIKDFPSPGHVGR